MYDLHNYNEKLLWERMACHPSLIEADDDFIEDVACLALNQLKPRYVRHDVDTAFYLASSEYAALTAQLDEALEVALAHVSRHPRQA